MGSVAASGGDVAGGDFGGDAGDAAAADLSVGDRSPVASVCDLRCSRRAVGATSGGVHALPLRSMGQLGCAFGTIKKSKKKEDSDNTIRQFFSSFPFAARTEGNNGEHHSPAGACCDR